MPQRIEVVNTGGHTRDRTMIDQQFFCSESTFCIGGPLMAPARTTAAARQISSMSSEPLLTEREAAEHLSIPSETLRYYRWQAPALGSSKSVDTSVIARATSRRGWSSGRRHEWEKPPADHGRPHEPRREVRVESSSFHGDRVSGWRSGTPTMPNCTSPTTTLRWPRSRLACRTPRGVGTGREVAIVREPYVDSALRTVSRVVGQLDVADLRPPSCRQVHPSTGRAPCSQHCPRIRARPSTEPRRRCCTRISAARRR